MVIALTPGFAYVLDWSAADADSYDLTAKVEGTNFFKIPIPEGIRQVEEQIGQQTIYFGGPGYFFRHDKILEVIRINGKVGSRTDLAYIAKYIKIRQSAGSDPDYLVMQFGANDQLPAYDYNGTDKNGVFRGWLKKLPLLEWNETVPGVHEAQIEFNVVWS